MRAWSLRRKITVLVVALVTGSTLAASVLHGWLALRALREDVRVRGATVASEIAFGITTSQELANHDLLAAQIRNILAARPTLRWMDIHASGPSGLTPVASSRIAPWPPVSVASRAYAENRTIVEPGMASDGEAWLAAAPIRLGDSVAGVVSLAISPEGANRLAISLGQQLLLVLILTSATILVSLALFTQRSITRPIGILLKTMAAVERGDLSAVPNIAQGDEMGRLAEGMTSMLRRIRTGHEENVRLLDRINHFNQDLQVQIAEATRELENRNEALRRTNALLFDLQRRLDRAQRLATMGQVTAIMAHEIGSPLNSIAVHLQILGRSPGLTEQDRQRLSTIDGVIRRLVQIVHERLVATRGETRRLEPTDLNALIQNITDLMHPILAGKKIDIRFEPDDSLPKISLDGHGIQQVLLNLLNNAVDAMPDGGVLRIATGWQADAAMLRISDTGEGVAPEIRDRIFEPFFTTKTPGKGTGLGLAISRQILEEHHATIQVRDTPGGGTTFQIHFPRPDGHASR